MSDSISRTQAGVRGQHRGQHGVQLRVDAAAQVRAEGVSERVKEARAAGVPALSGVRAGQPEVEVVVGHHHLRGTTPNEGQRAAKDAYAHPPQSTGLRDVVSENEIH